VSHILVTRMLFSFLVASVASRTLALRPELSQASSGAARIAELVSKISKPSESLSALQTANGVVDAILAEGPVSDHISKEDEALLKSVITLVEDTIYSSMDAAHKADQISINSALKDFEVCARTLDGRMAPDGDVGSLHAQAQAKQTVLDTLSGAKDAAEQANITQWQALSNHMKMIAAPPACPALPARTKPALDVFFEESEYQMWFAAQSQAYKSVRDDFTAANDAFDAAIRAYELQLALRDTQYCDWQREYKEACSAYEDCYKRALKAYTKLVTDVQGYSEQRFQVLKAGDALVRQIKFMLGMAQTREAPPSDTGRFEIAFGTAPAQASCPVFALGAFQPIPDCQVVLVPEPRGPGK